MRIRADASNKMIGVCWRVMLAGGGSGGLYAEGVYEAGLRRRLSAAGIIGNELPGKYRWES